MSEVDQELAQAAIKAIERLARIGTKAQKEHFTRVITALAECYGKDSPNKCVMLVSTDEDFMTMVINADPWEAAGLVQMSYDNLNLKVFQKMPDYYQAH